MDEYQHPPQGRSYESLTVGDQSFFSSAMHFRFRVTERTACGLKVTDVWSVGTATFKGSAVGVTCKRCLRSAIYRNTLLEYELAK